MLDCGANVVVQPNFLVQFATMGSAYMKALYGMDKPRVGLLNNGTEEHKGTRCSLKKRARRLTVS